jgi:hypothetical protein
MHPTSDVEVGASPVDRVASKRWQRRLNAHYPLIFIVSPLGSWAQNCFGWDPNTAEAEGFLGPKHGIQTCLLFENMSPARCKINSKRFLLRPTFYTKSDPKHDAYLRPKNTYKNVSFLTRVFDAETGREQSKFRCLGPKPRSFLAWKMPLKIMYIPAGISFQEYERGQKSYRFQLMFQGGLKTGQRERHVWMSCFWSQKSFGHRSVNKLSVTLGRVSASGADERSLKRLLTDRERNFIKREKRRWFSAVTEDRCVVRRATRAVAPTVKSQGPI